MSNRPNGNVLIPMDELQVANYVIGLYCYLIPQHLQGCRNEIESLPITLSRSSLVVSTISDDPRT